MGKIRKTIQQALVLEAVNALGNHPTMEQVYEEVRCRYPNIGRSTVYRNLLLLAEEGEIRSLDLTASPVRYDGRTSIHYHFKCRQCGDILDVDTDLDDVFEVRIKAPQGVLIETHDIMFRGLCPRCNKSETNSPSNLSDKETHTPK